MNPKTTPRWPGVPDAFVSKFGEMFTAVLSGWDRLRICGTLQPFFNPEWMRAHLCASKVLLKDFRAHAEALTDQIHARAVAAALAVGRPYRFLHSSRTSKEEVARALLERDRVQEGLITVLGAVEPCHVMTVRLNRETGRLEPRLEDRRALHLYHYFVHRKIGLCHVRVQTWYPFTIEVWMNGREWLARQMDEAGVAYLRRDNCFTHVSDPLRAQSLLEAQHQIDWTQLLNELLTLAHPLHTTITAPLRLEYYWTALQTEHATDLLCKDCATLEQIYPTWIRHGLNSFGCIDIMRFLGHRVPATTGRVNGRFKGEAITSYQHRREGVRLKHWVGQNSIKVYDKAGQVLRVETTLNAPEVFKLWLGPAKTKKKGARARKQKDAWRKLRRSVTDLPARAALSQAANGRYLQALAATTGSRPLRESVADVCQPVRWQGKRYRSLRLFAAQETAVFATINRAEFTVEGFRNADIQSALFSQHPRTTKEKRRHSAAAGRWLRLLRAHGLIHKVPGRHRYLLTHKGRDLVTLVLTASNADAEKLTAIAA